MTKQYSIAAGLIESLHRGNDILCVSHVAPDGDAVGSLLGMGCILRHMGKSPVLTLQDPVPVEHRVLPGAGDIITAESPEYESAVRQHTFDLIVSLDASSPDRMGSVYNKPVHEQANLVVIDHHITNTQFGDINWVEPGCAATCQMLVYLADELAISLEGDLAECLLTGIVTDTLAFRTSNTTPDVLGAAMRLMQGGSDLTTITQRTVNRKPYSVIKLWGSVLPGATLEDGVIWATVTQDDLNEAGGGEVDLNLSSFLVTADEADISAVFTEMLKDGQPVVECSFRAKPGFDVASVAFALGGGGHPAASGCSIVGPLSEVIGKVIPALKTARTERSDGGA